MAVALPSRGQRVDNLQQLIDSLGGVLTLDEKVAALAALHEMPVVQKVGVTVVNMGGDTTHMDCESHEYIRDLRERIAEASGEGDGTRVFRPQFLSPGGQLPLPDDACIGSLLPRLFGGNDVPAASVELNLVWYEVPRAIGISDRRLGDGCLFASSVYSNATHASTGRLHNPGARWAPSSFDMNEGTSWLAVDLQGTHTIAQIATQGNGSYREWTTSYSVSYSNDSRKWSTYMEDDEEKFFEGNADQHNVVTNTFACPVTCSYLRVHPKTWYTHACIRLELYEVGEAPRAIGISDRRLGDGCLFASSVYSNATPASTGRLHNRGARWAPSSFDMNEGTSWLAVDLQGTRTIAQIATQGNGSYREWTTSYSVSYSDDLRKWSTYMEDGEEKVFEGNADQHNVVTNRFACPVTCNYLRVHPKTWYTHACIRLELYEVGQ